MSDAKDILVVDDEPAIRALYQMAFAHVGHKVHVASTGEEAFELQEKQPSDLLFLDLNLPGIDGNELCRKIKARWPDTTCIAITGYTSKYRHELCLESGFSRVLTKPTSLQDLMSAANDA